MSRALSEIVRAQQRGVVIGGSPLYVEVLEHVAADVADDGPCAAVLAEVATEPLAAAGVLRFLRSVHEIVLGGEAPELARHYPSAGGRPGSDLGAAFIETVASHQTLIVERTRDPLQTNEVGRSVALLGGLLRVGARGPARLRVLELGASAGLNLRWDQYRYEAPPQAFGPPGAAVRFSDPWGSGRPHPDLDVAVEVVERRGCDLHPLDPADEGDRLRLRASVWPDQPVRRARLDAALRIAEDIPAPVDRADAPAWIATQLTASPPAGGVATVVTQSIVSQYLTEEGRAAVRAALSAAGERARPDAPLAWLRMEPADATEAQVRLTTWDGSGVIDEPLGRCGFHGLPVRWSPPPPGGAGGPRSSG